METSQTTRYGMSLWLAAAALLGFCGQPVSGGHQAAETAKLLASDGGGYDVFGWDVDVHGDYAIIGACADDEGGGTDGGAAFIFHFDGSEWGQQAKIVAGDSHANDMFGRSVVSMAADEGPAYGVALLAAVGAGQFKDAVEACSATVKTTGQTKPNAPARRYYDGAFPLYQQLYCSLRDSFRALAQLG